MMVFHRKNRKQNQESRLIQLITDKEKIEECLRFIQSKEDFVKRDDGYNV